MAKYVRTPRYRSRHKADQEKVILCLLIVLPIHLDEIDQHQIAGGL
jgi:hypothetical protein